MHFWTDEDARNALLASYDVRTMLAPMLLAPGDSFTDVSVRFATRVWGEAAALERKRTYPVLTAATWGTAWRLQDEILRANLHAVGLLPLDS